MLADFEIHIHGEDERVVQVKVHDNVAALRSAATQHERRFVRKSQKHKITHDDTLGVCHRFNHFDRYGVEKPLCALVRLAPPNLGVGVISHEMAHAAVWIRSLDEGEDAVLHCGNDERFCWILGELVRATVNTLHDKGVYDGR